MYCVAQVAHAFTYGVMKTGRTTFYGGAPDHMNPNNPSYGTLEGSCGCVRRSFSPWRGRCCNEADANFLLTCAAPLNGVSGVCRVKHT